MTLIDVAPSQLFGRPIGRVALDTETGTIDFPTGALYPDDGARVADVSIAWHEGDQVYSAAWRFWDEGGHGGALGLDEWEALCAWLLERPGIVMQNAPMDIASMDAGTGNGFPGVDLLHLVDWDTSLAALVLDPGQLVGLGKQSMSNLDGEESKKDTVEPIKKWLAARRREIAKPRHARNRQHRKNGTPQEPTPREEEIYQTWAYYLAPWELVRPYAANDAELTIRLARQQWGRLRDGEGGRKRWQFVHSDLDVMRTLVRMERRGIPYDAERSREIARKLQLKRSELLAEVPFDPTSKAELHDWFFERKKVKPLKVSPKTGAPSLDKETVDYLEESGVHGAAELGRYRKVDGAEIRWYSPFARMTKDGRLRPRFKQTAVRSGRLSIQRAQLQAIPHNHVLKNTPVLAEYPTPRDLISGNDDGWQRWEMDLAQAELRVAAWFANAVTMLEIIHEGRDPHGELAMSTFGVKKGDPDWFKYRQVGKRGNFSLIFGIGPKKLQADVRTQTGVVLSLDEATRLRDAFRDMHPEFGRAIKTESRRVLNAYNSRTKTSSVQLVNGRLNGIVSYEMDRDWDEDLQKAVGPVKGMHKAFNRKVQGSIGEFAKAWMVAADDYLMDQLADLDPDDAHGLLLQIHDALLISVPDNEFGEQLARDVRQIGIDLWDQWFVRPTADGTPFAVPGDIDLGRWNEKG